MTRDEMSVLLAMEPLSGTEALLEALREEADALTALYGKACGGARYSILEGCDSIEGMWRDLQACRAGRPVDFVERLAVFHDSGEVASWFAEMAAEGDCADALYEMAAIRLLTLYGLMALAAAEQVADRDAELEAQAAAARDDEECLA